MDVIENVSYPEYKGKLTPGFVARALKAYGLYESEMQPFRQKCKDNNKWYKCNYAQPIKAGANEPQSATAFTTNALFNRYADFIDNYPVPNIMERTPQDSETAKKLREIVPLLLEITSFKKRYKRNCYNKMKNGSGIYGVFYNENTKEIDVEVIDILDFFCDIHVDDLQDSEFVFVRNAIDNDFLKHMYPEYSSLFNGDTSIEGRDKTYTLENKTEILDCYYKKIDGGVHLMKLVRGGVVIDSTEDVPGYENGLYDHGLYPFVIDVMYPDDDNLLGFSLIDICRNPQMYIDKLDDAIMKNAMIASKPRFIIQDTGGININDFKDLTKDVIVSSTAVDETHVKQIQVQSLPVFVREHRENKIGELKEISGNRDWQTGGTAQGVTAASAIEALQSTGQKLSRANIDDTYDSYKEIIYMIVELVRQFFDSEETYRITDETGRKDFITFSNAEMYTEETDVLGFKTGNHKRAEFDISIVVQKENPFTRETNNQTIQSLWQSGYFNPQNMEAAVMALQCMNFDSRDKLIELMQDKMEQAQQEQTQMLNNGPSGTPVPTMSEDGAYDDTVKINLNELMG